MVTIGVGCTTRIRRSVVLIFCIAHYTFKVFFSNEALFLSFVLHMCYNSQNKKGPHFCDPLFY
jgi:hypothetical protein